MNEVFNNGKVIIHDDREFITEDKARDILFNGESIHICDYPNFGAENENEVYSMPFEVCLKDVLSEETYKNLHKFTDQQIKDEITVYLRHYELSK